jgi:GTPase Era involved in 16S rRNA processing
MRATTASPSVAGCSVADRLALVGDVAARFGLADLSARVAAATAQAGSARLGVAVLGQFKAGKSSLLNTLLGRDLLPVRAIPATSVVTAVRHGEAERIDVRLESGEALATTPAELATYVTEQRNPGNRRGVARVEVTTKALADLPNLVFVDTPGLGSVFDLGDATATGWLPQVGVALLAVAATAPLAAADLDLLGRLAEHTPHVLVVVTKVDLLAPADLADVLVFVAAQIQERTGRDLVVLPHSTAPGYDELHAALVGRLRGFQEHHAEAATALAEHRAARLADDTRAYLRLALAAAEADTRSAGELRRALAAERRGLAATADEARTLLAPHADRIEAAAVERMGRQAPAIGRQVQGALREQMAGWRGSLAAETERFEARLTDALAAALRPAAAQAAAALVPLVEEAREPLDRLGQAFAQRLAGRVRRALGVDFAPPAIGPATPAAPPVDVTVGAVFDSHLELLSWAVPMALVRPLVHRHFLALVRWQAEKNALRVAYRTAAAARQALDELGARYVGAMAAQVDACERLVGSVGDDAPEIRRRLAALDAAAPSPPA